MSTRELLQTEDRLFVEFTRSLTAVEWTRASLCTAWNTHEVLAHLVVGCSISLSSLAWAMVTHRGNFDQTNAVVAKRLAQQRSPGELIDLFEQLSEHRRGIGRFFPPRLLVGDHLIHHLDIALALGKPAQVPGEIVDAVLKTEVGIPNPFVPARRNASGLALRASDTGWCSNVDRGARLVVQGKAIHLASVLAGRPHALAFLSGDGVDQLRARITQPALAGQARTG
jgi:uncharacterized protein (TIGR03083 family)